MTLNRFDPYKAVSAEQVRCLGDEAFILLWLIYGCVVTSKKTHTAPLWFPVHPCEHDARYQ